MKNLKDELTHGNVIIGTFSLFSHPSVIEIIGNVGFDAVVIDTEHAGGSPYGLNLEELIRAAYAADIAPLVRTTENRSGMILKALDAGAQGIFVPHVCTKEDAAAAVAHCRYPPLGTRSAAPVVRAAKHGLTEWNEYVAKSNADTLVMVMVEDEEAVENIDEILSVSGIDGVFIGPWDLATDLGVARYGSLDESVEKLCQKIIDACRERNLFVGSHGWDAESVQAWVDKGCQLVIASTDVSAFVDSMQTLKKLMDDMRLPPRGGVGRHPRSA